MTRRQLEYAAYLEGLHWANLREEVLRRDGSKCRDCGSKRFVQAHHVFYRERFEDSLVGDLITLCRDCHRKVHGIAPKKKKPKQHRHRHRKKRSRKLRMRANWRAMGSARFIARQRS